MREENRPRWKIGELARRYGLNVRTLRYYEALGLLTAPIRSESGYRLYGEADELRLRFVLQAKRLGLSLEEIRRIIEFRGHGSACGYVRETLARHVAEIDARMELLRRHRAELAAAAKAWQKQGDASRGSICGLIEQWSSSPLTPHTEEMMANQKRKVEVFTAGCPVCEPAVELIRRVACPNCEVIVSNVRDDPQAAERAGAAQVTRLPMVLVDGQPLECCQVGPVTEAALRAAGVGAGS